MVKHRSSRMMFNPNTNTNAYHTSGIGLGVFVSAKRQDPIPESESHIKGQREWVRVTSTNKVRGKGQTLVEDQVHHDVALMVVKTGLTPRSLMSDTSVTPLPNHNAIGEKWKRDHPHVSHKRQVWEQQRQVKYPWVPWTPN